MSRTNTVIASSTIPGGPSFIAPPRDDRRVQMLLDELRRSRQGGNNQSQMLALLSFISAQQAAASQAERFDKSLAEQGRQFDALREERGDDRALLAEQISGTASFRSLTLQESSDARKAADRLAQQMQLDSLANQTGRLRIEDKLVDVQEAIQELASGRQEFEFGEATHTRQTQEKLFDVGVIGAQAERDVTRHTELGALDIEDVQAAAKEDYIEGARRVEDRFARLFGKIDAFTATPNDRRRGFSPILDILHPRPGNLEFRDAMERVLGEAESPAMRRGMAETIDRRLKAVKEALRTAKTTPLGGLTTTIPNDVARKAFTKVDPLRSVLKLLEPRSQANFITDQQRQARKARRELLEGKSEIYDKARIEQQGILARRATTQPALPIEEATKAFIRQPTSQPAGPTTLPAVPPLFGPPAPPDPLPSGGISLPPQPPALRREPLPVLPGFDPLRGF